MHCLQSKIDSLEKRSDSYYNFRVTFCYNCIMHVFKKEYPELDISKLETGVNGYIDEQNKRNEETETPPQLAEEMPAQPTNEVFPQPTKGGAAPSAQKSLGPNAGLHAGAS